MTEERLRSVLTGLVDKGELTQAQAASVIAGYLAEMPVGEPKPATEREPTIGPLLGRRKWLGEIGGYVGGAFTLVAGLIILGRAWSSISHFGKIGILGALAAILFGTGMLISGIRHGDAPRRLAGTLIGFGAISAAGAGGVAVPQHQKLLIASFVGSLIAALGYWRVRSASTHAALFALYLFFVGAIFDALNSHDGAMAIAFFLVGLSWVLLVEKKIIGETLLGLSIGIGTMVVAGELSYGNGSQLIAYLLLAATGLIGFRIYVKGGEWPPLAGAVVATTIGVGEIVGSSLGGAIGAAIGLLAAGLALLAMSAWLLRRRR